MSAAAPPGVPTFEDVVDAHERIRPHIHRTPLIVSRLLNTWLGHDVVLKTENLQRIGAFKIRGATNAVLQLSDDEAKHGVAAHSSGNHAAALALAARQAGIPAYIVMPEDAPAVKVDAVRGYGANITFCGTTIAARSETLAEVIAETGATEVHPFDNEAVIAGQGTTAIELLEDASQQLGMHLDTMVAPRGVRGVHSLPKAGHWSGLINPNSTSPLRQLLGSGTWRSLTPNRTSASKVRYRSASCHPLSGIRPMPRQFRSQGSNTSASIC